MDSMLFGHPMQRQRADSLSSRGDAVILDADGMPLSCRLLATPLFVVLWKSTCKWLLENSAGLLACATSGAHPWRPFVKACTLACEWSGAAYLR